jgi:hypothetical protein
VFVFVVVFELGEGCARFAGDEHEDGVDHGEEGGVEDMWLDVCEVRIRRILNLDAVFP